MALEGGLTMSWFLSLLSILFWRILNHYLERYLQENHPCVLKWIYFALGFLCNLAVLSLLSKLLPLWFRKLTGNVISASPTPIWDDIFIALLVAVMIWVTVFVWRKWKQIRDSM